MKIFVSSLLLIFRLLDTGYHEVSLSSFRSLSFVSSSVFLRFVSVSRFVTCREENSPRACTQNRRNYRGGVIMRTISIPINFFFNVCVCVCVCGVSAQFLLLKKKKEKVESFLSEKIRMITPLWCSPGATDKSSQRPIDYTSSTH